MVAFFLRYIGKKNFDTTLILSNTNRKQLQFKYLNKSTK